MKSRLLLLVFLFSFSLQAQQINQGHIRALWDSLCQSAGYPGATLSIIDANGAQTSFAYGYNDIEADIPMKPDDRMFSGSTGKTYVSAIIMQLIDEGKMSVDHLVSSYFEGQDWFFELPNAKEMTVKHLLNHTSGLPRYAFEEDFWTGFHEDLNRDWAPQELLAMVVDNGPVHPVGEGWGYSDTGYLLLGLIIEEVCGLPYYDVLVERVFKTFNLLHSTPSNAKRFPGLSQGYTGNKVAPFNLPPKVVVDGTYLFNPAFEYTGGGVVSNSPDLARWTKMLYEGEVFSKERLKELLQPVGFRTGKPDDFGYGYGVFIYRVPSGPVWGHGGFFFGYETQLVYLPDLKLAMAMQVNADQTSGKIKIPLMGVVVQLIEELRK